MNQTVGTVKHDLEIDFIEHTEYTGDPIMLCFKSGFKIRGPFADTREQSLANARFILKALACHDELVAALSDVMKSDRMHYMLTPKQSKYVWARQIAILAKAKKTEK